MQLAPLRADLMTGAAVFTFLLIAACQLGLLVEITRANSLLGLLLLIVLGFAMVFLVLGLWIATATSVLAAAPYLAVGLIMWFIAAPAVVLGAAFYKRVPRWVALSFTLATLGAIFARSVGNALVLPALVVYGIGWALLGVASGTSRNRSIGRAAPMEK